MAILQDFYLTVGVQYDDSSEERTHPQKLHKDGWVLIKAFHETNARRLAFEVFNNCWSRIYYSVEFEPKYFPKGCLGVLSDEHGFVPTESEH